MSILIKGMEMPTNEPLIVKINPDGSVSTTWKNDYKKYEAIPVPPHGRLKDADALYAIMEKEHDRIAKDYGDDDPFAQCLTKYAMSMVLSAPTILEAEEGEKL